MHYLDLPQGEKNLQKLSLAYTCKTVHLCTNYLPFSDSPSLSVTSVCNGDFMHLASSKTVLLGLDHSVLLLN